MFDTGTEPRVAKAPLPLTQRLWQAVAVASLLAAASIPPAMAQWSTQSPLPTHLQVRGVAAPAPGRVFLATDDDSFDDGGALFESNDGGTSWIQRDVPFDLFNGLWGISFFDDQHGWVWGNVNYRTTDGGTTWEELPSLGSAYFMEFSSLSFGVTTGNFGAYVSRDGGLTWAPSPEGMAAFSFADDLTGLGVAATGLYRTTDGGDDLHPRAGRCGRRRGVPFLDGRGGASSTGSWSARSTAVSPGRAARRPRVGAESLPSPPMWPWPGDEAVPIPTTTTASSAPPTAARPGPTSAR